MSTKSFSISNEMREKVADQLTLKAIEKHGKRIGAKLIKLNAEFWEAHRKNVDAILQIDPARYPELIQAGLLAATTSVEPKAGNSAMISFAFSNRKDSEKTKAIFRLIRQSPAYKDITTFLKPERYYGNFTLHFVSQGGSVPMLRDMERFEGDSKVAKQAELIRAEIAKVIDAAETFRDQTMDILISVRSSRQLTDLFPEAAKLLPEPVKRTTELAPVELVNSVRGMLESGVPTNLAQ